MHVANQDGQLILQVCSPDNEVNTYLPRCGNGGKTWPVDSPLYPTIRPTSGLLVNGRSFSREKIFNQQLNFLKKGLLDIRRQPPFQKRYRSSWLCVDEFAIFGSFGEEDQIREPYEAGNPYGISNSILSLSSVPLR